MGFVDPKRRMLFEIPAEQPLPSGVCMSSDLCFSLWDGTVFEALRAFRPRKIFGKRVLLAEHFESSLLQASCS